MKRERPLKKYEWHITFSQQYQAYAVKYYLHYKQGEKKYDTYTIGLYDSKEDAADAFNHLTATYNKSFRYKIDFMTTTWREKVSYASTTKYPDHNFQHVTKTSFDKLAEIVDRHYNDQPPLQKKVDAKTRAEIDANLEIVLKSKPKFRRI